MNNSRSLYIYLTLITLLIIGNTVLFYSLFGKVVLFIFIGFIILLFITYFLIKFITSTHHILETNERFGRVENINSEESKVEKHIRQTILKSNFVTHKIIIIIEISVIFILLLILIIRLRMFGG